MFKSLDPQKVNEDWNASLPKDVIQKLPELAVGVAYIFAYLKAVPLITVWQGEPVA
jgi:hypothetical protein